MAKNKDFKLVGKARPSPLGLLGNKKKVVLKEIKNFGNFGNERFLSPQCVILKNLVNFINPLKSYIL